MPCRFQPFSPPNVCPSNLPVYAKLCIQLINEAMLPNLHRVTALSWVRGGRLALYEIRTTLMPRRTSLVSYGEFPSDTFAILMARDLLRTGETIEIRRGDVLIYRYGANFGWHEDDLPTTHSRERAEKTD